MSPAYTSRGHVSPAYDAPKAYDVVMHAWEKTYIYLLLHYIYFILI